jgi:hypothetical protein
MKTPTIMKQSDSEIMLELNELHPMYGKRLRTLRNVNMYLPSQTIRSPAILYEDGLLPKEVKPLIGKNGLRDFEEYFTQYRPTHLHRKALLKT